MIEANGVKTNTLAWSALLNFLGQGLPILLSFLIIPLMVKLLGTEGIGILSFLSAIVGYSNLSDMGLGRAMTKAVSEHLASGKVNELQTLIWTGLILTGMAAFAGTAIIFAISPWLAHRLLSPGFSEPDILVALQVLGFMLPVMTMAASLRGVLEARGRFGLTNAVNVSIGAMNLIGPFIILSFFKSFSATAFVLVGIRTAAFCAFLAMCLHIFPPMRKGIRMDFSLAKPLITFGGWMTVSNILSPLISYLDRIAIAGLFSAATVAYYVTPFEVVIKMLIIPAAVVTVLFPSFSACFKQNSRGVANLYAAGLRNIALPTFPLTLVVIVFSREALRLWLGDDFAENSGNVLQILAFAIFLASLSQVSFTLVESAGRPDWLAKLHLAEVPPYLLIILLLTYYLGIKGAALAWAIRTSADATVLFFMNRSFIPSAVPGIRAIMVMVVITMLSTALFWFPTRIEFKTMYLTVVLSFFGVWVWLNALTKDEKISIVTFFAKAFVPKEEVDP